MLIKYKRVLTIKFISAKLVLKVLIRTWLFSDLLKRVRLVETNIIAK